MKTHLVLVKYAIIFIEIKKYFLFVKDVDKVSNIGRRCLRSPAFLYFIPERS